MEPTGIQERRFWPVEMRASEASAALAGKAVLEKSAFYGGDGSLSSFSGLSRPTEPATASYVHGLLGLPRKTQIFDLSNACLGFLNGLVVAGGLLRAAD